MAIGISNLQFVDMNSPRNVFIYGLSVLVGMALPTWLQQHPDAIQTGESLLQINANDDS
jgi:nucleobase transporter 1/2